jgi:hypothetical protein
MVTEITKQRFDAFAAYTRRPEAMMVSKEIAWLEIKNVLLGVVLLDLSDGDFGGIVLGRDELGRFRFIDDTKDRTSDDSTGFFDSPELAAAELIKVMERIAATGQTVFPQGGPRRRRLDPIKPVVAVGRRHPAFRALTEREGYSPAFEVVKEMLNFYDDPDGNFIEQFQSTGFDARLWELYLFGVFTEMGFLIDRTHNAPDFACDHFGQKIYVEAVILGQTQGKADPIVPEGVEQLRELQRGYIAHRFANALTAKLEKRYWKLEHVKGHPLMLAIADFSAPASMLWTHNTLPAFLYGYEYTWRKDAQGKLIIEPKKIEKHLYKGREIPSAFFHWDDAENISAVLFSNSGTISKFNRIGKVAGFGSPRVRMIRLGECVRHDADSTAPDRFKFEVHDPRYRETWTESVSIFHNPRAEFPVDPRHFPGATHHFLDEHGVTHTVMDKNEFHQFWSFTEIWLDGVERKPD